jgi:hypothetical protein
MAPAIVQVPRLNAPQVGLRARFFSFEPGLVRPTPNAPRCSRLWRIWGVHVPRIWIRSIGPREITVKSLMQVIQKKSQNVPVAVTKLSISSGAISVSPKGSNT